MAAFVLRWQAWFSMARALGEDQCGWLCTATFLGNKSQALHFGDITAIPSEKYQAPQASPAFFKMSLSNENNPYLSSSCQTFSLQSGCPSPGKSRSLICIRELCQLPPSSFLGSHSLLLPCLGSISFCWVPGHTDGLVPSRRQSHVLRFSAMAGTPHLPIS